ncbi:hypothetical protein B0H17DRAFT_945367, partial [Mycena rosella]
RPHRLGEHHVTPHDLSTLHVLGFVGEPINPEAWNWYNEHVENRERLAIRFGASTGSIVATPLPGAVPTKPGSATVPFFGHVPVILDLMMGEELGGNNVEGVLVLKTPGLSIARTIWQDHVHCLETYMKPRTMRMGISG